ncbi:protein of unknown function [Aquiflexum balticum DSM 16537]|uniref:DUF4382 domain-containing protein n=1 Tax=Aquiflexum balticum DSM 16537 TaxID=758820 RepID=A0A1W2H1R0_9BACT|nr:DUF4382 domain-containing protein [Aquiflexum balticum]SMD42694.1 protein of unknown function [Aquiflexum balticum DSM 16537]
MKNKKIFILALLVLSLGCSETGERSTALVNVFLIGTPGLFDEVGIEILGVEVKTTGTRGQDNSDAVFIPNPQVNQQARLSSLVNTGQYLVGRAEFLVGAIIELTLRLGNDNFVQVGTQTSSLNFRDDSSRNPAITVSIPLDGGISHDVFIDFNTLNSITFTTGAEPVFTLDPKFRAFASLDTGEISGIIRPQGLKCLLLAIQNSDTLANTTQDARGNFLIRGLEGEFTLSILPFSNGFLADTIQNIIVEPRQRTQLEEITLRTNP